MNDGIEIKPIPMYIDNVRDQLNEISNLINEFQYSINRLNGLEPEPPMLSEKGAVKECSWEDKSICQKLNYLESYSTSISIKTREALSRLNKLF